MKTKFFLTLTTFCLLLACNSDQPSTQKTDSDKLEIIPLTHSLFPNDNHYTIKIGQRMEYVFESYPSVGKNFSCYIDSVEILKYVGRVPIQEQLEPERDTSEEVIKPRKPQLEKVFPTGSYREIKKFIFEGIKEGTCELIINEHFRREIRHKMIFKITVEK